MVRVVAAVGVVAEIRVRVRGVARMMVTARDCTNSSKPIVPPEADGWIKALRRARAMVLGSSEY